MTYIEPSGQRLPTNKIEWVTTDGSGNGLARFFSKLEITGDDFTEVAPIALCRLYCLYIITRLNEKSLHDAYESLVDLYSWQFQQTNVTVHNIERHSIGKSRVKHIEKAPFAFREE